jgi:hypothetical protein
LAISKYEVSFSHYLSYIFHMYDYHPTSQAL